MNKIKTKSLIFLVGFLALGLMSAGLVNIDSAHSQSCPPNTEVGETMATLVGEVTDYGGDPNLEVWFQWGKTMSYGFETQRQSKYGLGLFCATIHSLEPNTTYHYRAVARNSAGTSYGENRTFTTRATAARVDLKANGSDGPIYLNYRDIVTLSWSVQGTGYQVCQASGDWHGSKSTLGYQDVRLNEVKTYTFTLTCTDFDNRIAEDSVQVIVNPKPPVVVTKPAVTTN